MQHHVVGSFTKETGALQKIDGILKKEDYRKIIKILVRKLKSRCNWVFQQDSDPKHISNGIKITT